MPDNREYLGPSERDTQVITACLEHAGDLITSADLLLGHNQPHVAFHLAVACLEEIGKSVILAINSVSRQRDDADVISEKKLDDHVGKLFWAFFGPLFMAEEVDQRRLDEVRGRARRLHETRLAALYVDADREPFESPRAMVPCALASDVVSMARAHLDMEPVRFAVTLDPEKRELAAWLLRASSDEHLCRFMFGEASLAKLRELRDWGQWIAWLRDRQLDARERFITLLNADRQRIEPGATDDRPRWKMRLRLAGVSHRLKPSVLSEWNAKRDGIQFEAVGTGKRMLDVTLTIPAFVPLDGLYLAALATAERLILALNIATCGFFWWEYPQHTARFFEKLVDLETKQEIVLSEVPRLSVDWGGSSLSSDHLNAVARVFAALPTRYSGEVFEPFARYLEGLSFLATINVHRRHENHAFACFYESFWSCLARLGDGSPKRTLDAFLRAVAEDVSGDRESRDLYALGTALSAPAPSGPTPTLEDVAWMKQAVDWYVARWVAQQPRMPGGEVSKGEA